MMEDTNGKERTPGDGRENYQAYRVNREAIHVQGTCSMSGIHDLSLKSLIIKRYL
jgi:hypothetical protein